MVFTKIQRCESQKLSGHVKLFDASWNTWYEGVCMGWGLVAVENQKVIRNQIWKKPVSLPRSWKMVVKLLGGSGQETEEGTLEKFEREKQY